MSSRFALSEPPAQTTELTRAASAPEAGMAIHDLPQEIAGRWRASRPRCPRMVAISPLWASDQKGCARRQAVVVLVE